MIIAGGFSIIRLMTYPLTLPSSNTADYTPTVLNT